MADPALEARVFDDQVVQFGAGDLAAGEPEVQLEDGQGEGAQAGELGGVDAVSDGDLAQHALVAGLATVQDKVGDELAQPLLGVGLLDVEVRRHTLGAECRRDRNARHRDTRRPLENGQG